MNALTAVLTAGLLVAPQATVDEFSVCNEPPTCEYGAEATGMLEWLPDTVHARGTLRGEAISAVYLYAYAGDTQVDSDGISASGTTRPFEFDLGKPGVTVDRVVINVCTRDPELPRFRWCNRPPLELRRH